MLEEISLKNIIYEIRGKQVMLDSDLAKLYQCKNGTKEINQAVKNNKQKFPERYSWELTEEEYYDLRSKFLTTNSKRRTLPRVFTEQGVAMLATILKTGVATQTSIAIMDAFVEMKKYIASNLIENSYYTNMLIRHDDEIKLLKETIYQFEKNNSNTGLFFKGQIYDAYSLLIEILSMAKENIIIIDNYIDRNLLNVLKELELNITIITNKYNNDDYKKYQDQYQNITLKINDQFHDRFIIIDDKVLYHCGASFKDLGKKCFAINKIENEEWLSSLLEKIKNG
ncbi:MAG: ORF6N domain-containing protein [Bacilli bacterium]|nr:ORF6N domain-containing protein [Bacilli bacterium]